MQLPPAVICSSLLGKYLFRYNLRFVPDSHKNSSVSLTIFSYTCNFVWEAQYFSMSKAFAAAGVGSLVPILYRRRK